LYSQSRYKTLEQEDRKGTIMWWESGFPSCHMYQAVPGHFFSAFYSALHDN